MDKRKLELYIHIPFCVRKCAYCDFLSFSSNDDTKQRYVDALIKEIEYEAYKYKEKMVSSVFIGGGTPSSLSTGLISKIMETVHSCYEVSSDAEITIECNPGTITREKLEEYRDCGINRLSIGLQSADDAELMMLGRIHNYKTFLENYELARVCGFKNINVDLISGLPGQKLVDFENTLKKVIGLKPEHISSYSLIIEEGTPFFDSYGEGKELEKELPDEEEDRDIYHRTREILEAAGYHQYEISNYAKNGYECRHNIGYWTRTEYVGFGIGAASLVGEIRWKNCMDLERYILICTNISDENRTGIDRIKEAIESLDARSRMEEYIFLGLRLVRGVDIEDFKRTFGVELLDVAEYKKHTEKMLKEGLLISDDNRICLSKKGLDLANYVMSGYIFE